MLLIDHSGKKSKILQITSTAASKLDFKTELNERLIMGKFGDFDCPDEPIVILRENFQQKDQSWKKDVN